MERDGADLVGMTAMPEAVLARELGLEYASIAVVANFAAGRGDSVHGISMEKIEAVLAEAMGKVRKIIEKVVAE
jgi:5'-methylthioadenosine phosphorylase